MNRLAGLSFPCIAAFVALAAAPARAIDAQPGLGEPLIGLSGSELTRFNEGKISFNTQLTAAQGLGPIMNRSSCGACHNNPIGGSGSISVTRFGFLDEKSEIFDPLDSLGGSLLQSQTITEGCEEVVPPEANVTTLRITNSALGIGLVEAIPDAAILANESPGPGISGRAHLVQPLEDPMGPLRVGRFGWKAQVATVLTFSADASLNELGLTNRLLQSENDPNGINPPSLATCDTVPDPEDGPDINGRHFIDRVTDFQRFSAAPPQTPKSGMSGETIFNAIGCNSCHISTFTTSNDPGLETAIRNKVIHPYSDFLLHDMGLLGDLIKQGDAGIREIRTPSLWGLRVRDPMLHDGRAAAGTFATRVTAAIGWHNVAGSEAQPSGAAFAALSAGDKDKVIAFLDSLGRREFDADGDRDVDEADFASFHACYGPGPYSPDSPCAVHDIDQDGDVDDDDFALFQTVYTGVNGDCNFNKQPDLVDILTAVSSDCDNNAVPDDCQPEYDSVSLFVAVLTGHNNNATLHCMYDRNHDTYVNGTDAQLFVNHLLGF
ncbi:MAG: di-heme oxidoredictase family protein [Phycisphaerae bacterium]